MKRTLFCILTIALIILSGCNTRDLESGISEELFNKYAGRWEGTLSIEGTELPLVFKIGKDTEGSVEVTMDSPMQNAFNIPAEFNIDKDSITIEIEKIAMEFIGRLTESNEIAGTFSQSGIEKELALVKTEGPDPHYQTPEKPFPYKTEDVVILNPRDSIEIGATVTIPAGDPPFPAVVMVTGSGQQDRDETVFGHKPFLVLSDYLTREGIMTIRYDDRGIGETGGNPEPCTSEDFARDAYYVYEYLLEMDESVDSLTGILGHSEGGMIAQMLAAEHEDIDFIVLMAAPGVTGGEVVMMQSEAINTASGLDKTAVEEASRFQQRIIDAVRDIEEPAQIKAEIRSIMEEYRAKMPPEQQAQLTDNTIETQVEAAASNWYRYFVRFDPAEYLKDIDCAVLAVNGGKDLQVPAEENLMRIGRILEENGNSNVTVKLFDDVNHLFQTAETGLTDEYYTLNETMNPAVMEYIAQWINDL
ncbi:MAG: alpha/beta hydrolase [bacterium]